MCGLFVVNFQVSASGFDWHPALCMYRGMFLVILCVFLLGINTYGWRSSGVNHVLIFELDPRNHLNHQQLLEVMKLFFMQHLMGRLRGDLLLTFLSFLVLSSIHAHHCLLNLQCYQHIHCQVVQVDMGFKSSNGIVHSIKRHPIKDNVAVVVVVIVSGMQL